MQLCAKNRLIEAYPASPASPANGDQKVSFAYDYQGRRVAKKVYTYAGGWPGSPDEHIKFVWHGWHLLAELDGLNSNAVRRAYTWGLDLSAALGGAGGIGGLLAVNDTTISGGAQDYVFAYDAMGNVTQVIDWDAATINDAIVASYEYDAYGNLFAESGAYASKNRWRMSTKPFDAETGFGYWGYRYYDAGLGRWLNRDPALEYATAQQVKHTANYAVHIGPILLKAVYLASEREMYSYVANGPTAHTDVLGLCRPGATRSRVFSRTCGFLWMRVRTCVDCQYCRWTPRLPGQPQGTWTTYDEPCSDCKKLDDCPAILGVPMPPACAAPPPAPPWGCMAAFTNPTATNCMECCDFWFGGGVGGLPPFDSHKNCIAACGDLEPTT